METSRESTTDLQIFRIATDISASDIDKIRIKNGVWKKMTEDDWWAFGQMADLQRSSCEAWSRNWKAPHRYKYILSNK